jgi:CDP-diacylglycerol--serine O-phosphatidyltransferase
MPMMLWFELGFSAFRSPYLNGVVLAGVGALMVSRVPTFSLKRIHVPREWVLPTLIAFGVGAAFLTTEPWATLLAVGVLYIVSFPVSILQYARQRRAAEAARKLAPPQARTEDERG